MEEDFKFVKKVSFGVLEEAVLSVGFVIEKDEERKRNKDNYRVFSSEANPRFIGRIYLTPDGKNVESVQINYQWGLPPKVYQGIFSFYGFLYEKNIQRKIILPTVVNGPDGT